MPTLRQIRAALDNALNSIDNTISKPDINNLPYVNLKQPNGQVHELVMPDGAPRDAIITDLGNHHISISTDGCDEPSAGEEFECFDHWKFEDHPDSAGVYLPVKVHGNLLECRNPYDVNATKPAYTIDDSIQKNCATPSITPKDQTISAHIFLGGLAVVGGIAILCAAGFGVYGLFRYCRKKPSENLANPNAAIPAGNDRQTPLLSNPHL